MQFLLVIYGHSITITNILLANIFLNNKLQKVADDCIGCNSLFRWFQLWRHREVYQAKLDILQPTKLDSLSSEQPRLLHQVKQLEDNSI